MEGRPVDDENSGTREPAGKAQQAVDLTDSGPFRWFRRDSHDDDPGPEITLRPAPKPVRTLDEALAMICEWMRYFAFVDAGAVGGPDPIVSSSRGLAHVSVDHRGIGTQQVMEYHKVAVMARKYALVFARGGFSTGAIRWANKNETALFGFDAEGQVTPESDVAVRLLARSDERHLAKVRETDGLPADR
jgi:hypothetical protein